MESEFHQSIFSSQFKLLQLWGAWPLDAGNPLKRKVFKFWSFITAGYVILVSYLGLMDFIHYIYDLKKILWNLAVNVIIVGCLIKNIRAYYTSDKINLLRKNLYRDLGSCHDLRETEIFQSSIKIYRKIIKLFRYPLAIFLPFWAIESIYKYFLGGETPLPMKWPWFSEYQNTSIKIFNSAFHIFTTFILLFNGMTTDLAMFGILLQICREYDFLLKDIQDLCDCSKNYGGFTKLEIEKYLKSSEIKIKLGKIISRQKELMKFTDDFEQCYNHSMLLQIFVGALLISLNCIQTLSSTLDIQFKTFAQGAYTSVIVMDIFILCVLGNQISDRCRNVGEAVYDLPWYTFEIDLRKDILLVILRSQDPPRLSAGRYVDLNLETFSETVKNVYSGMAVLRRIEFK